VGLAPHTLARGLALALAVVAVRSAPARAGGDALGLDAKASYYGYDFDSDWSSYQEHLFEESLRAEYSAFLVERSIASYNLGLTLGRADLFTNTSSARRFYQVDYNARTEIWKRGMLPVTLYARRQTYDLGVDAVPTEHIVASSAGGTAAFIPDRGPRLRARGYVQDTLQDGLNGSAWQRRWNFGGDAAHHSGRLNGRATLEREGLFGDLIDQQRVVDTAQVDAEYKVLQNLSVSTRMLSRTWQVVDSRGEYRIDTDSLNTHMRWTPRADLLGTATAQIDRRDFAGEGTSSERVGVTFGMPDGQRWTAIGGAGYEASSYDDADGEHSFAGEYLDGLVIHQQDGPHGSLRMEGSGSVARFDELGVGGGMQEGLLGRLQASRVIAGNAFRLLGGATLGRQWDSSPRDLDQARFGWEASMESRPVRGLSIYVQADQAVVQQLAQDEGDSNRFELYGTLRYLVSRDASLAYGISQNRMVLDDSYSASLGQSLSGSFRLTRGLVWSVTGHRYLFDDDVEEPWWWTRGETELRLDEGLTSIRARMTVDLDTGDTDRTMATTGYVELRRRWRWQF